ncbi:MAG: FkbM family methyltransferase [Bryobacterales bacterium]|nr:FkbM family methyltransferase [Bryobacterales bacterium]
MAEQQRGIYSPFGLGARAGDVVLDCGANAGLYVLTALRAGASKVIAIEPVPDNLECLRRNLSREIAEGKAVVVAKGVWDKEDFLEMNLDPNDATADSFAIRRNEGKLKLRLPLTTIDRVVAELNLPRVDYIKMDIEGAERQAVDGARDTIRKYRPRMALCVYHLRDDPKTIDAKVRQIWAGYRRSCGPCVPAEFRLSPEVYFYY